MEKQMSKKIEITEEMVKTLVTEEMVNIQATNAHDAIRKFEQAFDRVVARVNEHGYDYTRDTFMDFLRTLEK